MLDEGGNKLASPSLDATEFLVATDKQRFLSLSLSLSLSRSLSLSLALSLSRSISLALSLSLSLSVFSPSVSIVLSLSLSISLSEYLSLSLSGPPRTLTEEPSLFKDGSALVTKPNFEQPPPKAWLSQQRGFRNRVLVTVGPKDVSKRNADSQ